MKKQLSIALFAACCLTVGAQNTKTIYQKGWIDFNKNGKRDIYEDPSQSIDARVQDLLHQMSLEEKTCQMATLYGSGRVLKDSMPTELWSSEIWKDGIGNIDEQHNGLGKFKSQFSFPYRTSVEARHTMQRWFVENTRLGIPVDFTNEGIRGLCHDRATFFPAQCGQGATWNKDLIARIGEVTAKEANALGYTNIYSPILDIAQDPRWGRVVECYGEDPFLVGTLGKQMITALQKENLVATPKHFAVYSIPVGGRDEDTRTDPHVAPREMRTLYLEPFRMAFQEAGALGVMSSYNDYDGVPVSASSYFLTDILRKDWGFKGYVVSDSEAVEFVHTKHKVAETLVDAAAAVVNAGLNIRTQFTPPQDFILPLREAIACGKVSQQMLDTRVAEILRIKFYLGLFDNPYRGNAKEVEKIVHSQEHKQVSLEAARQSVVLLKNDKQILPLSKDLKRIAVIGPNADERKNLICRYGPANAPLITVVEGIKKQMPKADILYEQGCEIVDANFPESDLFDYPLTLDEKNKIDRAVDAARKSEVAIVVLGGSEKTVRESYSRSDLNLPGHQEKLLKAIYETGTPVVLVLLDGRAATINWADQFIPGIVHAWFPGEYCGQAVSEVLWGDYNPGGKLAVTFPKTVGQIPFAFPFKPGSDTKGAARVSGALYPFGYGLSYTSFKYSDLKLSAAQIGAQGNIQVECTITNTGSRKGDEVVQLYINDEYSSVTTYTKVLRGFERITLEPGASQKVTFTLTPQELGLWNQHNEFVVEPGSFEVMVGASSQDIRLKDKFEVR
ncbi:MAG: glycoside hydrolase family 3 N-terminal domain-containing protein [Tannerellaceae bacterium]